MKLEVNHLSKAYGGVPVLENVSFTAGPGIICLTAPSGAGKTTLLRILLGLETADGGTVSGLENLPLAAVFQEDRLLDQFSARENLAFVTGPGGAAENAALLAELGLEAVGGQPVRSFSGGMRRRVALARALAAPAGFLALDEPFTGLDPAARARCQECLRRRGAGRIILLATHREEDAADLSAVRLSLAERE